VLDYIFRELAISYLDRTDLAHVDPNELHHDSIGHGAKERDLKRGEHLAQLASSGYVRGNLRLLRGGGDGRGANPPAGGSPASNVGGSGNPGAGGSVTAWRAGDSAASAALMTTESAEAAVLEERLAQARLARLKGYEGDPCPSCANFTLVRSGTCLKCDTCGATTGCS
jgi:ribonucleoside-diphosphate reductase alpha chain